MQGYRTLFLHGMRMWPQTIDEIFWPFAIKAVAKCHNIFQIDTLGKIPESILYGVKVEEIIVKSYHTIFSPIYVLYVRLQNSGLAGPQKW